MMLDNDDDNFGGYSINHPVCHLYCYLLLLGWGQHNFVTFHLLATIGYEAWGGRA